MTETRIVDHRPQPTFATAETGATPAGVANAAADPIPRRAGGTGTASTHGARRQRAVAGHTDGRRRLPQRSKGQRRIGASRPRPHVSLIVPAHDEEHRLLGTLRAYAAALKDELGDDVEILVIVNGCTDDTASVARAAAEEFASIRVIVIGDKVGKGGAVLEGFRCAQGDDVAFADADGATAPASLLALVAALDDFDVVFGSRHIAGSRILRAQPVHRRVLGWIFARTVHALFDLPVRDTQCGAKALRAPIARHMRDALTEKQWAFDVELLVEAMRMGARICEHPVVWTDQPGSRLRVGPTALEVVRALRRIHVMATADRVDQVRSQPETPIRPTALVP